MREHVEQSLSVLRDAVSRHPGKIVYSCSFGAESSVLLELIHREDLPIPVLTLDTGRLPQETYDVIEAVERHYGIRVQVVFPDCKAVESMVAEGGVNLFRHSLEARKRCCRVRKVEPLHRALAPYDAWITGRRAEQSDTRADLRFVDDRDPVYGRIKYNPLVHWRWSQVMDFIHDNRLPYNALLDRHYQSIGCACCTRAITVGEDPRAGRWWWEQQDAASECGLHVSSLLRSVGEGEQGDGI